MTKSLNVFCEIPCLTEMSRVLSGVALQKEWFKSADGRYISVYLQKFIDYNSTQFDFLGVTPYIIGSDRNVGLSFKTTNYIGTIPLRAPDTGKQIGDFVVTPRFSKTNKPENYIDLINILKPEINPEIIDSLPLASGGNFKPPLYLEAIKYIFILKELIMSSWCKFSSVKKFTNQPVGQVNWNHYINNEFKIENKLRFQVTKNLINEFHEEYFYLRYVLDICRKEIISTSTPFRIKNMVKNELTFLDEKLYYHKPKIVKTIPVHFADSKIVKKCKEQANRILNFNSAACTAWRIDFSDVFEKYVQFVFTSVANEIGGSVYSNYKFKADSTRYYSWELKHLEPDVIYKKGQSLIFIDAKYKANLYNKYGNSGKLKEDHRHDLHQILAYSSFNNSKNKIAFLCYPSNKNEIKRISYYNSSNEVVNSIYIMGIPPDKDELHETKRLLANTLNNILS